MDSLTQIILGAAAGEVVLGKKIGNKAMVIGALAGTIPDLDVISGFFLDDLGSLSFHRGISHSIFFSVFGSALFAYLTHHYFQLKLFQKKSYRWIFWIAGIFFFLLSSAAITFLISLLRGGIPWILVVLLLSAIGYYFYRQQKLYVEMSPNVDMPSYKEWYLLYFWAILTHVILDCFTGYGTQIFAPFSSYRLAWSNISVVDPMYTIPFLLCLLIASLYSRSSKKRRMWNYAGIFISSLYMVFTIFNKSMINNTLKQTADINNIEAVRYHTTPTIFNNLLWYGIVESDSVYYCGVYSLFDKDKIFNLTEVPKNHHILNPIKDSRAVEILSWFSNDYYLLIEEENSIIWNDLRFGTQNDRYEKKDDFIFNFTIDKENPVTAIESRGGDGEMQESFTQMWDRLKGK